MAVAKRSAPSVRPRYVLAVVAIGTGLAASGGCKHHRYGAMRPKFVGPATVVPVEPSPAPGITAPAFEDEAVTPPSLLAPADPAARPGLREAPRLEPSPADPAARPGLREAPRLEPSPADPAARPGLREAPRLEPSPADPAAPAAEPDENDGLMLETPGTSRRGTRPAAPVTRQATLRTRLTRYVNDPDDLFQPPKADRSWRYIVLHHSAQPEGSYPEVDREHRSRLGSAGCGYHFVIGNGTGSPDGQIEVARRWSDQRGAAHCRDAKTPAVNDYGIGICLVGNLDQDGPTPKQIEAAQSLVDYLESRYNIPTSNVDVHARLAQNPTACPGKHFPAQAILGSGKVTQARHFAAKLAPAPRLRGSSGVSGRWLEEQSDR